MVDILPINPSALVKPVGFAHGVLVARSEKILFMAGQCGYDADGRVTHPGDLVAQFECALDNLGVVLREAGMDYCHTVQVHLFVRSRDDYAAKRKQLGMAWKHRFGRHYPAMALFEVNALFDPQALIEITGVAAC